jgi:hypothetical protein
MFVKEKVAAGAKLQPEGHTPTLAGGCRLKGRQGGEWGKPQRCGELIVTVARLDLVPDYLPLVSLFSGD